MCQHSWKFAVTESMSVPHAEALIQSCFTWCAGPWQNTRICESVSFFFVIFFFFFKLAFDRSLIHDTYLTSTLYITTIQYYLYKANKREGKKTHSSRSLFVLPESETAAVGPGGCRTYFIASTRVLSARTTTANAFSTAQQQRSRALHGANCVVFAWQPNLLSLFVSEWGRLPTNVCASFSRWEFITVSGYGGRGRVDESCVLKASLAETLSRRRLCDSLNVKRECSGNCLRRWDIGTTESEMIMRETFW